MNLAPVMQIKFVSTIAIISYVYLAYFLHQMHKNSNEKKNAHNTEKSQQNSNCSTNCNIKIKKCTLSLTKIKRNEKTKSGATSKTKFALIILINYIYP